MAGPDDESYDVTGIFGESAGTLDTGGWWSATGDALDQGLSGLLQAGINALKNKINPAQDDRAASKGGVGATLGSISVGTAAVIGLGVLFVIVAIVAVARR